jgi:pyruvate formate lyase activating enzyme
MQISGITPFTTIDFPETIACILFTAGCNFRCSYCHNSEFVLPEKLKELKDDFIHHEAVFQFLKERQGKLDGVVITGGEPTMHHNLLDWMERIQKMGFKVKLDSNGNKPEILKDALDRKIVDYIAMDIKCMPSRYEELAGKRADGDKIIESINILKEANIPVEFRTVAIEGFHKEEDFEEIRNLIKGASVYRLLKFRPGNTLCPSFALLKPFSNQKMKDEAEKFSSYVDKVICATT